MGRADGCKVSKIKNKPRLKSMSWKALEDVLKPMSVVPASDLGLGVLRKLWLFVMELEMHTRLTQELQKLN